jgi:uncharacterized OsmC-like protein
VSQVAAKKRLTLRNERVKVIAHFREEGSVLGGTQKGICEDFSIELSIDGDMPQEEIATLVRLAHRMCFTESALLNVVKTTSSHRFNGQPLEVDSESN